VAETVFFGLRIYRRDKKEKINDPCKGCFYNTHNPEKVKYAVIIRINLTNLTKIGEKS
jgi:hypothetical protein